MEKRYWMWRNNGEVWWEDAASTYRPEGTVEVLPVEVGSRAWAIAMLDAGEAVMPERYEAACARRDPWTSREIGQYDGAHKWVLVPPAPPPWVPQRGERVRGWRDGVPWTGPYLERRNEGGHWLGTETGPVFSVERVEQLPKEEGRRADRS